MKKRKIRQSPYRILMSEVLPYELPMFFTNNRYYIIADRLRLCFKDNTILYRRGNLKAKEKEWSDAFITLLNGDGTYKKSFNYYINKNNGEKARELVVIHPFMQLKIMELYKSFDSLILNFCQKSHFSLRYPRKRATLVRPRSAMAKIVEKDLDYKANDNPKHYFYYRKFQNINAFYEGRDFQRLESRFKFLYKADIYHCFDTIPIHELPQVLYQTTNMINSSNNFAAYFAQLMSEMDSGRNHSDPLANKSMFNIDKSESVLIGPEFSRIFAEMFLQQIDVKIEKKMSSGIEPYLLHRDYECLRYVDDIFFFYNDNKVYSKFYGILIGELRRYGNMRLNYDKNHIEPTPFVNNITIAKRDLRLVVEKILENRLNTTKGLIMRQEQNFYDFPLKMSAQYTIIDVKTILSRNKVGLSEVSAGMLAFLHRRLGKVLDEIDSLMNDYREANEDGLLDRKGKKIWIDYENRFVYYFRELIKFLFYLFNNDMRMSTSIRILSILNMIVSYCQGKLFQEKVASSKSMTEDAKNKIYKTIVDELTFILKHNELKVLNGLEISNLLLILKSIPENYEINASIWKHYLGDAFNKYSDEKSNAMIGLTLLMIFGRNSVNSDSLQVICNWLLEDLCTHDWSVDDTESFIIMMGMMTSPFVNIFYKKKIINHVQDKFKKPLMVIGQQKSPFMQWSEFILSKACQNKFLAEVY